MGQVVRLRNYDYEVELAFATAPTRRQIAAALREAAARLERFGIEEPETGQLRGRDGKLLLDCYSMAPSALLP